MKKNEFYNKHSIDPDDVSWLGSGDFGSAYSIDDKRVLKITSSKSEFRLAGELLEKGNIEALENIVDMYDVKVVDGEMWILMESLDTDSEIEDKYYMLNDLLESQSLPIQYMDHLDIDELDEHQVETYNELSDFISGLEGINYGYRYLGIEASDIRPENMGYNKDGILKAFDIEDKSVNEQLTEIKQLFRKYIII